jgi:IS1 family transposase
MVLTALAEGLDASAAERVFGYRQATITTWLTRAGQHAQTLHERCFRNLHLPHLQLDELRTRLRSARQVLWLWLAIDPRTKILPVLQLGPRTQYMAHLFIHDLRQRVASSCLPLFTSDGLNLYFYALTAHFGQWLTSGCRGSTVRRWQVEPGLIYGQVKKCYQQRKLVRVSQVMRLGTEDALQAALQRLGFSGRLNTAFIERVNLTVRHGVAALARRTWATAQQSSCLLAHLEWWRAYYHFVRPHETLQVALLQPHKQVATVWHNATDSARRRWQPAELIGDGRHVRCSLTPCRRFRLERPRSQVGVVSCCGEMDEGTCRSARSAPHSGRADLSGLPHHQKPARSGSGKGWSIYPPCSMAAPPMSGTANRIADSKRS